MKKLLTMMLALGSLAVFVGCGGDDAPFGDNELVVGEVVFPINYASYYETTFNFTGGVNRFDQENGNTVTHTAYVIRFTDSSSEACEEDCNYIGTLYLISKGGDGFTNGTFNVTEPEPMDVDENTESFAFLGIDNNPEVYEYYGVESISGGTIKVSGEAPNFTITFNFEAEVWLANESTDEVSVKGQFKGEIPEQELR